MEREIGGLKAIVVSQAQAIADLKKDKLGVIEQGTHLMEIRKTEILSFVIPLLFKLWSPV